MISRYSYWDEISIADGFEDLVNGAVGGEGAVEDVEMPLESGGNVVPTPSWVDHSGKHLNVHDIGELSRLLQIVETLGLHHLSGDFIGHLQMTSQT